ncbi:MAG: phosphatidylglycerophosphatase A [Gallionellaceae bacterium]
MRTSHDELKFQPNLDYVFSHPARLFAFGFGAGLFPRSPGTVGTLVAFPLYWYLAPRLSDTLFILLLVGLFALGVWACEKTGQELGVPDYGGLVWDEIVAFMLVLFFTPAGLVWQVLAFSLFRLFDIWKPQPIRHFDRTWHGGLGVMFDDILAAGYALLSLAAIKSVLMLA